MLRRTKYFISVLIILFYSCSQNEKKVVVAKKDTVAITSLTEETSENKLSYEEQEVIDSTIFAHILDEVLKIAARQKTDIYELTYEAPVPDISYTVSVTMKSDFHFTKEHPHLIIRRQEPGSIMIDIYSKENNHYKKVLSHNQWSLTYTGNTIRDINGDGINDFVLNWYGSSGCCLKAFSDVYLLRSDRRNFSDQFEFINPTFSPEEKVIRGVCYGQPGETEMYKHKWNGESVDTLEYVYFEWLPKSMKRTGKIIVANRPRFVEPFKIYSRLNKVPSEYRNIDGFDWFMGDL